MLTPLNALADELGLDRSAFLKWVRKQRIPTQMAVSRAARGQQVVAVTQEDADRIRQMRGGAEITPRTGNGMGWFYAVQVAPDLAPLRVKVGFADDVTARLDQHRTAAPTAELYRYWPCKRAWEVAAIDAVTIGCERVRWEVFNVDSLEALSERADRFFALMPSQPDHGHVHS